MSAPAAPTLKVVIAGDGNVGKTSLIRRYAEGKFEASRVMTIGVDFQTKLVTLPDGAVKLSIWDVAGQERFQAMRPGFYRGSRAAALVFDVTDPASFANLLRWQAEVRQAAPQARLVVVGNKTDLARGVPAEAGPQYAAALQVPYLETSAASGAGVPRLFEALAWLARRA